MLQFQIYMEYWYNNIDVSLSLSLSINIYVIVWL